MAQKHLFKAGKKNPKKAKKAANRHGKVIKMKKGNFVLPPTGKKDKEKWKSELVRRTPNHTRTSRTSSLCCAAVVVS